MAGRELDPDLVLRGDENDFPCFQNLVVKRFIGAVVENDRVVVCVYIENRRQDEIIAMIEVSGDPVAFLYDCAQDENDFKRRLDDIFLDIV